MKLIWSLVKQASDPAAPAVTPAPQPVAPTPAVNPPKPPVATAPAAPAAPVAPAQAPAVFNPSNFKKTPEYRAMRAWIDKYYSLAGFIRLQDPAWLREVNPDTGVVNSELIAKVKRQYDKWMSDPSTASGLQMAGEEAGPQQWVPLKKALDAMPTNVQSVDTGLDADWLADDRDKPEQKKDEDEIKELAGDEEGTELDNIDNYAQADVAEAMKIFATNFAAELQQNPWMTTGSALSDAFFGNTTGKLKKWKQLFIDNPQLLPSDDERLTPELPKALIQSAINEQLEDYFYAAQNHGDKHARKRAYPSILTQLKSVMGSKDPTIRKTIWDYMKRMFNTAKKSEEMSGKNVPQAAGETDSGEEKRHEQAAVQQDQVSKSQEIAVDQERGLPSDEAGPLNSILQSFVSSPANAKIIAKLEQMTAPMSTENPRPRGVELKPTTSPKTFPRRLPAAAKSIATNGLRAAFLGYNGEESGEFGGRWREFFKKNLDLVPCPAGFDPARFIDVGPNRKALLSKMNELAKAGDPKLQQWVQSIAENHVRDIVSLGTPMPTVMRHMDHLTTTICGHLHAQAEKAKAQGDMNKYRTLVRREEGLKAKMFWATKNIAPQFEQAGKMLDPAAIHKLVGEMTGKYVPNDWVRKYIENLAARDPSLLLKRPISEDSGDESGEMEPGAEKAAPSKGSSQRKPSETEKVNDAACRADMAKGKYTSPFTGKEIDFARPPVPGKDPGDRLAGYRKKMGDLFWEQLIAKYGPIVGVDGPPTDPKFNDPASAGVQQKGNQFFAPGSDEPCNSPEEALEKAKEAEIVRLAGTSLASIYHRAGHNPAQKQKNVQKGMDVVSKILEGGNAGFRPVSLGWDGKPDSKGKLNSANVYSKAIGIPVDSWFFRPPEFDPYNENDVKNINNTLGVSVDSWLALLKHRQMQAKHKGRSEKWVDPKALYFWVALTSPYSHITSGKQPKKHEDFAIFHSLFPPESPYHEDEEDQKRIRETLQQVVPKRGVPKSYFEMFENQPEHGTVYEGNPHTGPVTRHKREPKPEHVNKFTPHTPYGPKTRPRYKPKPGVKPKPDWYHHVPASYSNAFGKFVKAYQEIERLDKTKSSLSKYASATAIQNIDYLIDLITEEAIAEVVLAGF